ncbi:MAG: alpha/beta hydrolase family protein [Planctomycetaceae bacterium]
MSRSLRRVFAMFVVLTTTEAAFAGERAVDALSHQDPTHYLDADGNQRPVTSPDEWQIRRRQVLENMQTVMGPLPTPTEPVPLDVRVLEEQQFDGHVRRKIAYHTDSPERVVNAYLLIPTNTAESQQRPAMLVLHSTTRIGKEQPVGLGDAESRHIALHLVRRGYVTLAPDYPSFGEYEYDFEKDDYTSGTMKAIYDNIRAVDLLQSLDEVDDERIGVIGHSLGGHNSMFTAVFEPRLKVIVSSCGFTRFHKYYEGRLKGWTSARYMPLIDTQYHNDPDRVPFDFPEIVAALAPRPFFASSPLHDSNFEVSGVRDTIAAARPIYELLGKPEHLQANYPDCEHDFPPKAREVAYKFLDRHLKPER